jgi:hypothetical protein
MTSANNHRAFAGVLVCAALALTGCQSGGERTGGTIRVQVDGGNIATLQRVNERALACWIKSNDPAFRKLALVPELDTRAGRPRILVVERGKPQGLPKLVIEAEGTPARMTTYGPLAAAPVSARINDDIIRWAGGAAGCA